MNVKILSKERILDDFFQVDSARLQFEKFSGGWSAPVRRLNLERGEAVAVLIYLKDVAKFILIRQFRYAAFLAGGDGWIDEIVAGVQDGEDPLLCARRECIEESGYEIDDLRLIASVFSTPGITTERVHIYLGVCLSSDKKHPGGGLDEEHEDIQIIELDINQARERLQSGGFNDGKTILALQYFFLNYQKESRR